MVSRIKALSVTMLAVASIGTVSASSATASPAVFHSHAIDAHTTLSSSQHVGEDVFTFKAGTVSCTEAAYHGTMNVNTTSQITLQPTLTGCKAFGFVNAPIDTSGCHFTFTANSTTGAHPTGQLHVNCTFGNPMTITAFNCWVTVGSQSGLSEITYTNKHPGDTSQTDITVDMHLTNMTYTQHSKSFPGCSNGTFTDGAFDAAMTLKGFATAGNQVGLWYH